MQFPIWFGFINKGGKNSPLENSITEEKELNVINIIITNVKVFLSQLKINDEKLISVTSVYTQVSNVISTSTLFVLTQVSSLTYSQVIEFILYIIIAFVLSKIIQEIYNSINKNNYFLLRNLDKLLQKYPKLLNLIFVLFVFAINYNIVSELFIIRTRFVALILQLFVLISYLYFSIETRNNLKKNSSLLLIKIKIFLCLFLNFFKNKRFNLINNNYSLSAIPPIIGLLGQIKEFKQKENHVNSIDPKKLEKYQHDYHVISNQSELLEGYVKEILKNPLVPNKVKEEMIRGLFETRKYLKEEAALLKDRVKYSDCWKLYEQSKAQNQEIMQDVVRSIQEDKIMLSDDEVLNNPKYRTIQERVFNAKVHLDGWKDWHEKKTDALLSKLGPVMQELKTAANFEIEEAPPGLTKQSGELTKNSHSPNEVINFFNNFEFDQFISCVVVQSFFTFINSLSYFWIFIFTCVFSWILIRVINKLRKIKILNYMKKIKEKYKNSPCIF